MIHIYDMIHVYDISIYIYDMITRKGMCVRGAVSQGIEKGE